MLALITSGCAQIRSHLHGLSSIRVALITSVLWFNSGRPALKYGLPNMDCPPMCWPHSPRAAVNHRRWPTRFDRSPCRKYGLSPIFLALITSVLRLTHHRWPTRVDRSPCSKYGLSSNVLALITSGLRVIIAGGRPGRDARRDSLQRMQRPPRPRAQPINYN